MLFLVVLITSARESSLIIHFNNYPQQHCCALTSRPVRENMETGVFIPIGNNGWLISDNSPTYKPSFELNKQIVQKAESYGMDFALSMIKLRGFGGRTEHWDYNLESFTLSELCH